MTLSLNQVAAAAKLYISVSISCYVSRERTFDRRLMK